MDILKILKYAANYLIWTWVFLLQDFPWYFADNQTFVFGCFFLESTDDMWFNANHECRNSWVHEQNFPWWHIIQVIFFDFQANGINLVELIIPIVELFVSFVLVLVSCELAGRLTNEFNGINDLLNQFNWYLFPLDVQNLLPIIMANTQQSVYLECFGRIPCDRETFKKVR